MYCEKIDRMLLADSHITMLVGVDIHVTTAPTFNPIHPYIGMDGLY